MSVVKFAGYECRTQQGINSDPQKWSLTFDRSRPEILAIRNFLKARGALEAFNWTTPEQVAGVFVCRGWRTQFPIGRAVLTCTFEQVFES